jgi:NOL1/NOP2/fmu family ribosome biogenesis protein
VESPAPGLEHTFRLWPHLLRGEGHYAAVLRREGPDERPDIPAVKPARLPPELSAFCRDAGAALPEGVPVLFGSHVYLAPAETPELSGLRVLRAGLELGEVLKNRFEPAHAWALWLKTCAAAADFPADSPEIARYLAGQTLPGSETGWTLVRADGLSLGWAKGSGGTLKNHYPKALRRPG